MTDESLSALLDGECSPAEVDRLLDQMERDPALQERFSRMCLARDGRQGVRVLRVDAGFSGRVMASIEGKPAGNVIAFRPRWLKHPVVLRRPALGFAAAATVAAVAVFAVRPGSEPIAPVVPEPAAAIAPAAPAVPHKRWAQLNEQDARQLGDYVMTHDRTRTDGTGLSRYAKNPEPAAEGAEAPATEPQKDAQP